VPQRALLGQLEVRRDLGERGVAAALQEGEDGLASGVHDLDSTSFSTPTLKYPQA
jgi:hypothetical protein